MSTENAGASLDASADATPETQTDAAGEVDSLADCPRDGDTGALIRITSLSPGRSLRCGGFVVNVTFDYYPKGSCTPIRDLHDLDFAGAPLTSTCVKVNGYVVGGVYGNVDLTDAGSVEDYTGGYGSYDLCYKSFLGYCQDSSTD